jgi:heavy metal translocating P-type ATPase
MEMEAQTPKTPESAATSTLFRLPQIVHEIRRSTHGRLRLRRELPSTVSASAVRSHLGRLEGVRSVRINRKARSIVIQYGGPEDRVTEIRHDILGAVGRLDDDGLHFEGASGADPDDEADDTATALLTAAIVAALVPVLPVPIRRLMVLASIGQTVVRGLRALFRRGMSVEVLDAAAVAVPALRGAAGTAATTNLMLQVAAYVENRASRRSDDLVRSLLRTEPESVRVERDGVEIELPYAQLSVGDRVVVMPGEIVAVDGVVVDGAGTVDASAITGESLPVPTETDDIVKSGVIVLDGRLVVAAERVGDATTVARIRKFMERALAERSSFQRVADRMADRRVWVTFGTAAGVYALTRNLGRLESISLVDFSCTSKLGTAVSIKSALYRAGSAGVLIKGGDAMEALANVDTILFDKTGTLSTGQLRVTNVVSFDPSEWPEDRLLALAASLGEHTSHPVAASVVDLVRRRGLAHIGHEEVDFMVGHGLTSRVEDAEISLGSRHFLVDHRHVDISPQHARLRTLQESGDTLLYLARDREVLGVIALHDETRPEARTVIDRLRTLGIQRVMMVSGDARAQAHRIGSELGLDGIFAEVEPEDKAGIVHSLKDNGKRVAFVGDGVNDGPALMAADVGIAMPRAADIARATADVVLIDDQLEGVTGAIELSKATLQRLHGTLNKAAAANTAVLALAATGRIAPITASLFHNGTTLAVLAASWAGPSNAGSKVAPGT